MKQLITAFFKAGSGSLVTMLFTIISTKIMAVMLGPQWTGLNGMLAQTIATSASIATLNGSTAIVQGAASRSASERYRYLAHIICIYLVTNVCLALGLWFGAPFMARWLISDDSATARTLFRLLIIPIFLSSVVSYCISVINAHRGIGRLALIQIVGGMVNAAVAYPAARAIQHGNTYAIIWSNILAPLAVILIGCALMWRAGWLQPIVTAMRAPFERSLAQYFFKFAGVTFITGLAVSGIQLLIRAMIVADFGLAGVGIFNAAWTMSMTYVTLVVTALTTYYLPTLSATHDVAERTLLMQRVFRFVTVTITPLIIGVMLFKPLVIRLLFAPEYLPATKIMHWMLIGDYFKVTSWVFAMPMLAYADLKAFFWSELVVYICFLGMTIIAVKYFNSVEGVGISFLLMYIGYSMFTWWYARSKYQLRLGKSSFGWFIGLSVILVVSFVADGV